MSLTTPHPGYPLPGHEPCDFCQLHHPPGECSGLIVERAGEPTDAFNAERSAQERDLGIARVEASTDEWQQEALAVIRSVAQAQSALTTDDIWRVLGRDAELEGRAMGAAMRMAAKLGYVRRTDTTRKSERVACHRRDLRVWESLLRELEAQR